MAEANATALRRGRIGRVVSLTACLLLAAISAAADHVMLQNGDRITGAIQRLDGDTLLLKSEALGDVRVKIAAIASVVSDQPLRVVAERGKQFDAERLELTPEGLSLFAADGTTQHFQRAAIASIVPANQRQEQNPASLTNWTLALDAGISGAHGNAETLNSNFGVRAVRVTPRERLSMNFTSLLARSSTQGQTVTTANTIRSGIRYDLNLSRKVFTFGFTNFESDRAQKLDLRNVLGAGAGLRMIDSPTTQFDIFTGGSFNHEFLAVGEDRRSGEMLFGHDLSHKMTDRISMGSRFSFYPNMSDTGEYRATLDTTTTTKFNSWLGWQVTLSNIYVSNPPIGAQNNDLLVSTGLRLSFGQERPFQPRAKVGLVPK